MLRDGGRVFQPKPREKRRRQGKDAGGDAVCQPRFLHLHVKVCCELFGSNSLQLAVGGHLCRDTCKALSTLVFGSPGGRGWRPARGKDNEGGQSTAGRIGL